jgi:hypothetical protein
MLKSFFQILLLSMLIFYAGGCRITKDKHAEPSGKYGIIKSTSEVDEKYDVEVETQWD